MKIYIITKICENYNDENMEFEEGCVVGPEGYKDKNTAAVACNELNKQWIRDNFGVMVPYTDKYGFVYKEHTWGGDYYQLEEVLHLESLPNEVVGFIEQRDLKSLYHWQQTTPNWPDILLSALDIEIFSVKEITL